MYSYVNLFGVNLTICYTSMVHMTKPASFSLLCAVLWQVPKQTGAGVILLLKEVQCSDESTCKNTAGWKVKDWKKKSLIFVRVLIVEIESHLTAN